MRTIALLTICYLLPGKILFPQSVFELEYKLQHEKLRYKFSTYAEGSQESRGTRVVSERSINGIVSLQFVGETALQLEVKMIYDSLEIYAVSELGKTASQNPSEVIGLPIKKVIARNGDQLFSTELGEFGVLPAALSFSTQNEFLTNLPDNSINAYQSFRMTDTDTVIIAAGVCLNDMNLEYKYSGKEVAFGYNCVKLNVKGETKLSGDFWRHGTQFIIAGVGTITGTILFSPEKGLLVASTNQTKLHLNVLTSGDEPVSIPVVQTSRSSINLLH